jgi:hypothetical protein
MHENETVRPEAKTPTAASERSYGYITGVALVTLIASTLSISGCKHTAQPDDASLTQAVQTKIAGETSLASEPIQASVQQGVATLNGTTSNDAARSLAANDAAQVSGIKTVVNNLTVVSSQPAPTPQTASVAPLPPAPVYREPRPERKPRPVLPVQPPPAPMSALPEQAQVTPPPAPAPIERSAPSQPPAPPRARSITLPADTIIPVRLNQTLDSATTQEGDSFSGVLASDVLVEGNIVLPQGTAVSGRVDTVQEAAHFKGNSLLVIQLTSIHPRGANLPVSTDAYSKAGEGRGKNSTEKIGGGAAIGAVLGGIFGGGKGAAIGAAAGGGAGAGAQAITRGQQVQIPAESLVRFRLTSPLTVKLSGPTEPASDAELQRHN